MSKPKSELEKRLAQLKKEVPTRGFERHPSLLRNISDLPVELQTTDLIPLVSVSSIDTIIAFPPQIQHGWSYVPRQALLFKDGEVIHLLASIWPGQPPQITTINGKNLTYMRVTLLLLYGCLEIISGRDGSLASIKIEFNTVAWSLLSSPLEKFLQSTAPPLKKSNPDVSSRLSNSQTLMQLPYKFSNGYHLYGKLPGEELEELVFQPVTYKRWLIFPRRLGLSNTLLLLTTNFLIVIQDDPQVKLGWILAYIPRKNIAAMEAHPSGKWNELTVQLNENNPSTLNILVKDDPLKDWHDCWVSHGGEWLSSMSSGS